MLQIDLLIPESKNIMEKIDMKENRDFLSLIKLKNEKIPFQIFEEKKAGNKSCK
jgi:hypothetical protein